MQNKMLNKEMHFDVIIVGGGPAGLSLAIQLSKLYQKNKIPFENKIAVLEKGAYFGAHTISGGILDPIALKELIPDYIEQGFPHEGVIDKEEIHYLTKKRSIKLPFIPPFLENRGHYVVSLSKMANWMSKFAEKNEIVLLKEVAAVSLLENEQGVCGVRTDDRMKEGDHYKYPGYNLYAKTVILAEGSAGYLTRKAIKKYKLDEGKAPSIYELGVKEIYEVKEGKFPQGKCAHFMGYPLTGALSGGCFMYAMNNNRVGLGLIAHLGTSSPNFDPHEELQRFKKHPKIAAILEGGKNVGYGAKTLPCGGYYSIPKLTYPGLMIVGDGANLVDSRKLKGLHTAMQSGIEAANAIFENNITSYEEKIAKSWIIKDLKKSRNFTPAIEMGVPLWGGPLLGFQILTGGMNLTGRLKTLPDFKKTKPMSRSFDRGEKLVPDDKIVIDKLTDVYLSRAVHSEEQGSHIKLLDTNKCLKCKEKYNSPCTKFCPAQVYDVDENGHILINYSNCLHCKTCDLKCPLENIEWNLPQGCGGPQYTIQ